ncbi:MAG: diguanylate cyclase [Pseudomonadota bacterium]|nr:diguanylate cyclase [Pseudomonadota bacterium]
MNPLQQDNAATLARLHDLDRAIASHAAWLARFNRQLICREAAGADDLAEDAHTRCRFGAWFYSQIYANAQADLAEESSLAAIESAHRSMHDIARHLLVCQAAGESVPGDDYDAFTAIANQFRQQLRRLELDLMGRLGAVDNLTGVWNRQAVNLRLAEEIERVQRTHQPCAVCYADLDDFGRFNEAHGQRLGDAMLKAVVSFFADHLRRYDTIFRIGGEEFLLCLPSTDILQAGVLIDRLRVSLAAHTFVLEGQPLRLTASFGVVALEPVFFIDETLERVERAQLIAKAEGGNQVCVWRDEWEKDKA